LTEHFPAGLSKLRNFEHGRVIVARMLEIPSHIALDSYRPKRTPLSSGGSKVN
jgi:hypothetical protein